MVISELHNVIIANHQYPLSKIAKIRFHLLINPTVPGIPTRLKPEITIPPAINGIFLPKPLILSIDKFNISFEIKYTKDDFSELSLFYVLIYLFIICQ